LGLRRGCPAKRGHDDSNLISFFLGRKTLNRRCGSDQLTAAIGAFLELYLAFGKVAWADEVLRGNSDQIGGGEFGARTLIEIISAPLGVSGLAGNIETAACGFLRDW
jgi:hypothetical protein